MPMYSDEIDFEINAFLFDLLEMSELITNIILSLIQKLCLIGMKINLK